MSFRIKNCAAVSIGRIKALGLASFIRKKDCVVVGNVRRRNRCFARQGKSLCRHQIVKFSTGNFGATHRKIIVKASLHRRTLIDFRRYLVGSQENRFADSLDTEHSRKRILLHFDFRGIPRRHPFRIGTSRPKDEN